MKSIDRNMLRAIRPEIQTALAEVAKKYGVILEVGNASFTPTNASFKLLMAIPSGDAPASGESAMLIKAAADFKARAILYGLKADDLGRSFEYMGSSYKILGLLPKRSKFPILCLKNGKQIILPEGVVAHALKASKG